MNLRELYLKAMACTDNTEVLPDQEAGALKSALIQDINHAYFRIARERCAPRARVEVVLSLIHI